MSVKFTQLFVCSYNTVFYSKQTEKLIVHILNVYELILNCIVFVIAKNIILNVYLKWPILEGSIWGIYVYI